MIRWKCWAMITWVGRREQTILRGYFFNARQSFIPVYPPLSDLAVYEALPLFCLLVNLQSGETMQPRHVPSTDTNDGLCALTSPKAETVRFLQQYHCYFLSNGLVIQSKKTLFSLCHQVLSWAVTMTSWDHMQLELPRSHCTLYSPNITRENHWVRSEMCCSVSVCIRISSLQREFLLVLKWNKAKTLITWITGNWK